MAFIQSLILNALQRLFRITQPIELNNNCNNNNNDNSNEDDDDDEWSEMNVERKMDFK